MAVSNNADQMILDAEESYNALNKAGGAWNGTGELIEKAKQAAAKKNLQEAIELAAKAIEENKNAQVQLESQKKANSWLF